MSEWSLWQYSAYVLVVCLASYGYGRCAARFVAFLYEHGISEKVSIAIGLFIIVPGLVLIVNIWRILGGAS